MEQEWTSTDPWGTSLVTGLQLACAVRGRGVTISAKELAPLKVWAVPAERSMEQY